MEATAIGKSMIHGYDEFHWCPSFLGYRDSPQIFSLFVCLNSWDLEFCGVCRVFFALQMMIKLFSRGGDNLLKIHGSWENMLTPAQNKNLMATRSVQSFVFCVVLAVFPNKRHENRWDFPSFKWIIHGQFLDSSMGGNRKTPGVS